MRTLQDFSLRYVAMAVRINAHPTGFSLRYVAMAVRMNAHPTKKIGAQDIVGSPFMATVVLAAARMNA